MLWSEPPFVVKGDKVPTYMVTKLITMLGHGLAEQNIPRLTSAIFNHRLDNTLQAVEFLIDTERENVESHY